MLALGAKAGRGWEPRAWEDFHVAFADAARGRRRRGARARSQDALARASGRLAGAVQRRVLRGARGRDRRRVRASRRARRARPARGRATTRARTTTSTGCATTRAGRSWSDERRARRRARPRSRCPTASSGGRSAAASGSARSASTPTRAREAGGQSSRSTPESQLGHEEIYFVLRGRARFTIDGNEHELGAGQFVFVRDPALRRGAVALDEDTVVLALGGKPGAPHTVSAWEAMFAAVPAAQRGALGRGDRDPRGGARRAARAPGAPLQPRLHGGARRAASRRAAAPEARGRARAEVGARTPRRTPTSRRSAHEPGFPA